MHGVTTSLTELIALQSTVKALSTKNASTQHSSGQRTAKSRGRGMDVSDIRNYQAGDEIRHMEWRVTARTGKPHTKLYAEEKERPVVLLVDFSQSMYFGTRTAFKSYVAAQLAGLLAWTAMHQGDKVGGLLFSETQHHECVPKLRKHGVLPLLARLCEYTERVNQMPRHLSPRPLSDGLLRLKHVTKPGSLLVLISDFYTMDSTCEQQLTRLTRHNDLLAYCICDSLELSPPPPGHYPISDGAHTRWLNTHDVSVSRAYLTACQQRLQALTAQFSRLNSPFIQVTADTALPQLIQRSFPRRTHG